MEESNDETVSDSDKSGEPESSSDDEHQWKKAVKEEFKKVQHEKKLKERRERMQNKNNLGNKQTKEPKFYEIKDGASVYSNGRKNNATDAIIKNGKLKKLPLLNRLQQSKSFEKKNESSLVFRSDSFGNKQMTFLTRKVKNV